LAFRDKKNIRRSPRQMISHKKYDFQLTLMKIRPYISFDETSARPLYLSQVLALPQNNLMHRLKNPEETLERALESIRDLLDLWKMGAAFDTEYGCENFYKVTSAHF